MPSFPNHSLAEIARRAVDRCNTLSLCSDSESVLTRLFCTQAMKRAHRHLIEWMHTANMTTSVDALGNLSGLYSTSFPLHIQATNRPRVLIGSHVDTVRNAGKYDGILGVMLGLALIESMEASGIELPFDVQVIAFSEEEGVRYATPYLGSMAVAGCFPIDLLNRVDSEKISMKQTLIDFGCDLDGIGACRINPLQVIAYIEAHIEQGPLLEATNKPIGIVTAIVGQSRLRIHWAGKAGHAGTTPMQLRSDSLAAASEAILAVEEYAKQRSPLVATVGYIENMPNASNVIPGNTSMSLDVRHSDDFVRIQAVNEIIDVFEQIAVRRSIPMHIEHRIDFDAVPMSPSIVSVLSKAASMAVERKGSSTFETATHKSATQQIPMLSSGAGHDAAIMAKYFPSGMVFIRSPGGISHHPDESVQVGDVEVALSTLLRTMLLFAEQSRETT